MSKLEEFRSTILAHQAEAEAALALHGDVEPRLALWKIVHRHGDLAPPDQSLPAEEATMMSGTAVEQPTQEPTADV